LSGKEGLDNSEIKMSGMDLQAMTNLIIPTNTTNMSLIQKSNGRIQPLNRFQMNMLMIQTFTGLFKLHLTLTLKITKKLVEDLPPECKIRKMMHLKFL
jgi:hypothetical protein